MILLIFPLLSDGYAATGDIDMECDEFLNSGIRYRHTSSSSTPHIDYIPLHISIIDT